MALELQVSVPAARGAIDPLELLVGDGNVVEHRLHVAGIGQHVVVHLVQEGGHADVPGPLLGSPPCKPDTGLHDDALLEIVDAVGRYSQHSQSPGDDGLHGDRLGPHQAADTVEDFRELGHRRKCGAAAQAAAEQAGRHAARVRAAARVGQRAGDIPGLEDPAGGDAAVGRTAEPEVAQVVGQHVVPGVVQDLVVRDEVDLDVVTTRCPYRLPRFQVGRYPGPAESHRVVGDDQLVRPGGR